MMRNIGAMIWAFALMTTPAISAETTGTQMLFDTDQIAAIDSGTTLNYSHTRSAVEEIETVLIENGAISVNLFTEDDKRRTKITLINGKHRRSLEHMPGDRGNPIFIVFLESTLQAIAKATKGSPFYLRNRFKDAMATGGKVTRDSIPYDGGEIDVTYIEYQPFAKDKNRAKLGDALADMVLKFTMSDAIPGKFLELSADAQVGDLTVLNETIRFDSLNSVEE